jgi:putative hydrolase of the HAD superfamily
MIKTIFFDLDDTLYLFQDSSAKLKAEVETVKRINEKTKEKLHITFNEFIESRHEFKEANKNNPDKYNRYLWFDNFLTQKGIKDINFAKDLEVLYWEVLSQNMVPYEDLRIVLPELSRKYKLYVLTDGLEYGQIIRMKALKFDKYFDGLLCSDQHNSLKPDKQVFDYGLKVAGCKPEESIMIGDKPHKDIRGSNNAFITSIWIQRGKYAGTNPIGKDKAKYTIKNYFRLLDILEKLDN